jgi:hypothetical protein
VGLTEFSRLSVNINQNDFAILETLNFSQIVMKRLQTFLIYSVHGNYLERCLFSDEGVSRGVLFVV